MVVSGSPYREAGMVPLGNVPLEKKVELDIQNRICTINSLKDLYKIDTRTLSKLEIISFKLPYSEFLNEPATAQVKNLLAKYDNPSPLDNLNEFGDAFALIALFTIGIAIPIIAKVYIASGICTLISNQKIRTKRYEEFCELRERINNTYRMQISYRSYPALEERIIGD